MVRVHGYGSNIVKATEQDSLIRSYHNDNNYEERGQLKVAVVNQNDLIVNEEPRSGGGVFLVFLVTIAILGILTFLGADKVIGRYLESLTFESDTDQLETPEADIGYRNRKLLFY